MSSVQARGLEMKQYIQPAPAPPSPVLAATLSFVQPLCHRLRQSRTVLGPAPGEAVHVRRLSLHSACYSCDLRQDGSGAGEGNEPDLFSLPTDVGRADHRVQVVIRRSARRRRAEHAIKQTIRRQGAIMGQETRRWGKCGEGALPLRT